MKKTVLFSLIFSALSILQGQVQKMTLRQCIDYAWSNNLDIRQSLLNREISEIDVRQSKTNLLPTISASAGQNYQLGRTVDRYTNVISNQQIRSNNFGINGNMILFNGFQNINNIKQQTSLQKASNETLEYTKNTIALNVTSAFLQVILAMENTNTAQIQIQSTQQRIDRAQKQVDAGVSDLSNLLSLKAQIANEQLTLVNATNSKNAAMLSLRNLMQIPLTTEFDIEIPSVEGIAFQNDPVVLEIYETALNNLPQIKSAIEQNNAAKSQTNVAMGNMAPTISMYASIGTVYSQSNKIISNVSPSGTQAIGFTAISNEQVLQPTYTYNTETKKFNEQFKDNIGESIGFSLNWNLFTGFQTHNQIQKAKINQLMSDMNLQKQKNTLLNDINTAVNSFNAARAKYDASKNSVDAQNTSLEYIQKRFDAGVSTSFDFINAKNSYLQAKSNELQAKYELVFRALIIEYYKGNTITL